MNKKIICGSFALAGLFTFAQAAEFDLYGHFGAAGQKNTNYNDSDYAGASASIGFNVFFTNGISIGLGGWAAIPIYENVKNNADQIYKDIFVLSDAYFAYNGDIFNIALGRYDTNNMGYDWFSGHNQGVSLGFNIGNFLSIWGLYSHQQAFQFQRFNRETSSQINALWNYKGHYGYYKTNEGGGLKSNKEHFAAAGVDVKIGEVFRITPYVYFVTNNLTAPGGTAKLTLGRHNDLYSDTTLKYTHVSQVGAPDGHLLLADQEFGYSWFRIGGGYYKTIDAGAGRLTDFGDDSRFYGGIVEANVNNRASGGYYGYDQSTWYVFTGARHEMFKFDLLYANGGYKEFSALLSITLFKHLDFGAGYVDLANIENNRRNYVTGFVKAIW
ncbi:hypothetical protein CCY99_08400 [Helicobacter sp. 16-1353]|uniref:hypothetical protein n=1 Tax=Helicobacter sp. 16-1353 TaxID=2004996 RepID=UPI000DCEDC5E|nr:hypothetical protein [Helicobacter sp. 16-1353]RAX51811.1 hypothetical protein CCY99_08400 [Helicobacter sp. 16-1353]